MPFLSKFFIDRPIVKWVTVILMFLAFLFSVRQVKRYAFPRVDLNEVLIQTTVPGFSASEVELEVTDKIEEKLKQISGIEKFTSTSYQNFSSIFIKIDPNENEVAAQKIKDKIRNEVSSISDFPDAMIEDPNIIEISIDNKPMMVLGVVSKLGNLKNARTHALALKERLLQTGLVSQVNETIQDEQVHILISAEKLERYDLSLEEVIGKLKKNQARLSSGTLTRGNEVKRLITYTKAESLDAIRNLVVRSSGLEKRGVVVRLSDVAKVEKGLEKQTKRVKFNGMEGYKLSLVKKGEADILDTTDAINQVIVNYKKAITEIKDREGNIEGEDLKIIIHDDDSRETKERLGIAYNNAIFGLILVCFTLFFFLNRSIAFWSCLGIPSTMFLTVTLMWINGVSINTVSLCGIIIMMGIIVDNPTVIGESVYHYRQMNFEQKQASLTTLERMVQPLIFAGLTTAVSFGSMFFIPGTLGQFASEIPKIVIFMLVASFFESTLILPSHLASAKMNKSKPWGEGFVLMLRRHYERTLKWSLKHSGIALSLMLLFMGVGVVVALAWIKFQLFPIDQAFKINFNGKTEINSSLEFTEEQSKKLEGILESFPEKGIISSYQTTVGGTADNEFEIQLRLVSYFDRTSTAKEFKSYVVEEVERLRKVENKANKLSLESFDYFIDGGGVPAGRPIEINVFARNLADRKEVIEAITEDMKAQNYFSEVLHNLKEGKLEYQVVPNVKASFANIDAEKISQNLRFAYEGLKVGNSEIGGLPTDWWMKYDEASKDFNDPLKNMFVLNPQYRRIEMQGLVTVRSNLSISEIQHEGGYRKNVISANFDKNKVTATEIYNQLIEKYGALNKKYPNVRLTFGGEAKKSADTLMNFIFAIVGSVIIIYLLLVIEFGSFFQPFMVITSIPFGIVGIVIAFSFHGYSLSFLGMIGVLGFGGVVINASLIMVDYINKVKNSRILEDKVNESDFLNRKDYLVAVVVRGAAFRFRPILITTFTTVIGLVPTAYGVLGRTDIIIAPMTLTMLWGLVFGTLGGLYAVPMFYLFDQKISDFFNKRLRAKRQ